MSGSEGVEPRELVRRTLAGDAAAYAELLRRFEGAALRLALRITGDRSEAEDAVQEAFLRAYRSLARFDPERPFGPWLLKIAANRALTRAGRRRTERPLDEAAGVADPAPGPESTLAGQEDLARVREALTRLSPGERAVLSLHYEEGLPLAGAAEILGITENAAKVRLFRARQSLLALLSAGGGL